MHLLIVISSSAEVSVIVVVCMTDVLGQDASKQGN
jgi:hypothetical protein